MVKAEQPARRMVALSQYGGLRFVVHVGVAGASQAEAEAAALEQLRAMVARESLTLEELELMTAALVIVAERRANTRYPKAMREYYQLEAAYAEALESEGVF